MKLSDDFKQLKFQRLGEKYLPPPPKSEGRTETLVRPSNPFPKRNIEVFVTMLVKFPTENFAIPSLPPCLPLLKYLLYIYYTMKNLRLLHLLVKHRDGGNFVFISSAGDAARYRITNFQLKRGLCNAGDRSPAAVTGATLGGPRATVFVENGA